ncbi:hypothetical protein NEILACOT_04184 [Neisseria lactamica ATCC 23970]|uniref:Uncharacterized protein n=1 Tax=Neisseria lactamica ATCC 23970 TaxID=546265 RepID=D0W9H2_NEILA|nr:hypothetical protein NEILACOT_04184 [Neisseria lactamica ATCC 23970]
MVYFVRIRPALVFRSDGVRICGAASALFDMESRLILFPFGSVVEADCGLWCRAAVGRMRRVAVGRIYGVM